MGIARRSVALLAAVGLAAALPLILSGWVPQNPVVRYPRTGSGQFRYAFTRQDTVVASMPGGETQTQVIGRTAYLIVTWNASDSGTRIGAAIDSVVPDEPASRFSPAVDSALSARWSFWRRPTGQLSGMQGGPASSIADEVRDQIRFLFPTLPPGGATAGVAWRDSTEGPTLVSAFEAHERARATFIAASGPDQSLTIAVARDWSATGSGRQYSQPIAVQASGTDSLAYVVTGDGVVLDVKGRRLAQLELDLPAVGQRVSARVRSAFAMRLLP